MAEETSGAQLVLDPAATSIALHTFAEGLFSRLAHDLEIAAEGVTGTATTSGEGLGRASIDVPVAALRVVGAVKKGKVDPGVLSTNDRADIEGKIRSEVLAGSPSVHIEAELKGGRAQFTVVAARNGRATISCAVTTRRDGSAVEASGRCDVSLASLGIAPVKGPLGAFRLSDRVEIFFRATFRPVA